MNAINWRGQLPGAKLLIAGAEYEFLKVTNDDVVQLRLATGLRNVQTLTIGEARQLDDVTHIVVDVPTASIFHDDDLLKLDQLWPADFDLTLERMALVWAAKEYEAANPAATKMEIAKYARTTSFTKIWNEKFAHLRKSGRKTLKCNFSQRTAEHYLLKHERYGIEGLISREFGTGKISTTTRADPIFVALAARANVEQRDGRLLKKHECWKYFLGLVSENFNGCLNPAGMISRRTFERWLDELPKYEVLSDRNGVKFADDALERRDVRQPPARAFDEVEFDCKYFDSETTADPLIQFSSTSAKKASRPLLVMMVDRKTGYSPAYRLFLGSPSSLSVQETIVSAFVDRSVWRAKCGLPAKCPVEIEGIQAIKSDGGNEFIGKETLSCFEKLNINFKNVQAKNPHLRGKIEGLNAIIAAFVCWLPGQIGRHSVDRKNRAEVVGELSIDELNRWFTVWVENIYHQEVSWGSHGLTRQEAVIQDQKSRALRSIPSDRLLAAAVTVKNSPMANRHGIRFENHSFNNDQLANFVRNFGDRRVRVIMYAANIGSIDAELDGNWVTIPNTDQRYDGVTLSAWRLTNAAFVLRGKKIANASMPIVVEATMKIQERMHQLTRENGVSPVVNVSGEILRLIDECYDGQLSSPIVTENKSVGASSRVGIDLSEYE